MQTSDKTNGTENALFLSRAPSHDSFTFNLYELKHKVRLSRTVGFSIFDSISFLLKFMF